MTSSKSPLIATFRRFSTADWIIAGTAAFIICNGVSVLIGWWLRIPIMVQLSPNAPTHFNTALIFILLGLGELGLVLRRRGVVMAMAVIVTCIASAELAEYALGLNLGIDTLFAAPFVGLDARYPGRMSSNTIACFLLICAAQVLMSKPDIGSDGTTTAAVILKTHAGGIAFLAILGYLVGLKSAHGWTDAVGMSIRSSVGFLLLFIARIAALWRRDIMDKPGLPSWFMPFLAISGVVISVGLIWTSAGPLAQPFVLDPLYNEFAHRRSIAMILSVGTLTMLGAISVLVARHKAVMALASEKKLSSVLERMSEGVMLIDAKGDAFYQNPASLRIHGFDPNGTGFIKTCRLAGKAGMSKGVRSTSMSGRFPVLLVGSAFKTKYCARADARPISNSSPITMALRSTTTTGISPSALLPYRTLPSADRRKGSCAKANSAFGRWPTPSRNSHGWPVPTDTCSGTTSAGTTTRVRRRSRWKAGGGRACIIPPHCRPY